MKNTELFIKLCGLPLHELRIIARHFEVKSPTALKKCELIDEVSRILDGGGIVARSGSGRPAISSNLEMKGHQAEIVFELLKTAGKNNNTRYFFEKFSGICRENSESGVGIANTESGAGIENTEEETLAYQGGESDRRYYVFDKKRVDGILDRLRAMFGTNDNQQMLYAVLEMFRNFE